MESNQIIFNIGDRIRINSPLSEIVHKQEGVIVENEVSQTGYYKIRLDNLPFIRPYLPREVEKA